MDRTTSEQTTAIAALLTEFCWRVDQGLGDTVADLFVEDGRVDTPNFKLNGRAEIHAWFAGKAGTKLSRHCWSNLRVAPLGPGRFQVDSNLMTTSGPLPAPQSGGKLAVTSSRDEVLFEGDEPRFVNRTLEILFEGVLASGVQA